LVFFPKPEERGGWGDNYGGGVKKTGEKKRKCCFFPREEGVLGGTDGPPLPPDLKNKKGGKKTGQPASQGGPFDQKREFVVSQRSQKSVGKNPLKNVAKE